ncbi:MAG: hypothetical protein ACRBBT_11695 [Paracoccaceae bacterium]
MMRAALVAFLLWAAPALAGEAELLEGLGAQGCVIGADAAPELRALADQALGQGTARQQGDWVLLPEEICTIRLPQIETSLSFDDPELRKVISDLDPASQEAPGCFLDTSDLGFNLSLSRGWAPQQAFDEMNRFIAAMLIAGEMTFYSDDLLRTPMGFQRISGPCADVADIDAMRRNSAQMVQHFGAYIRWQGETLTCGGGATADFGAAAAKMSELSGGQTGNVWMPLEYLFIGLAAGWLEGAGPRARGLPRPPLCHYQ